MSINGTSKALDLISDVLVSVPQAQRLLDQDADRNQSIWKKQIGYLKLPSATHDLFLQTLNPQYRISEFQIDASFRLERTEEHQAGAGLGYFAQPLHTFYVKRFGSQSVSTNTVAMTCHSLPIIPNDQEESTDTSTKGEDRWR